MAKKLKTHATSQIRIIGGQWRRRKLPVLHSLGLRPTTDRVRETLFNWLTPVLQDARCLDCFAGSGALGLEALSRHASNVTLLELEHLVAQQLKKNLALLNASDAKVFNVNTLNWLAEAEGTFDVVFLDPPFRKGILQDTLNLLEQNQWLADEAWIYVETEAEQGILVTPTSWLLYRKKIAGQVAYHLYHRNVAPANDPPKQKARDADQYWSAVDSMYLNDSSL